MQIEFAGAKDTFGESGKPMDLLKKLGLGVPDVMAASEKTMGRKTRLIKLSGIKPILQMGFLLLIKNPEPKTSIQNDPTRR